MPRQERPLEAGDNPLLGFAADLRLLRQKAGLPTYRQLSRAAHYSVTVLAEAAAGRKLPSLAVTLAYVNACGGDTVQWRQRWQALSAASAAPPAADTSVQRPPYPGLAAFQQADADLFFGRERIVGQLLARLGEQRFLGVFGASGCGKSSLLRAGLAARASVEGLDGRIPRTVVFTPGPRPREECALRLAALTGRPAGTLRTELAADPANLHLYLRQAVADQPDGVDVLWVVDQFEEVFTVCRDAEERAWFVSALVQAARAETSRVRVVLGVRADFYGHCGQHPELVEVLQDSQVLLGAMTAEELRQAITRPAGRAACTIETALVSRLVAEAAGQPAALPLVSHTLLETWRRRRGTRLTLVGYEEAGGIQHALARSAERVCTAFTPAQLLVAKHIFLRLTALGEGTEDTKRRISRDTLDADEDTATVLEELARTRLITLDDGGVEITHEVLIRCWPRLREWLADDRAGLRIHHRLTEATDAWESVERDPGALYRGTRLALARDWAGANDAALSTRERDFLTASLAAQDAEQSAARRGARRLRRLVTLLTVLLVLAATAMAYAVHAERTVATERDVAIVRKATAQAAAVRGANPALSVQVSLGAYRLAPNAETRDSLLSTLGAPYAVRLTGVTDDLVSLAFSPDGRTVATASWDHTACLWDVADLHHPRRLATITLDEPLETVALGPGGRVLATVTESSARLWDIGDLRHPKALSTFAGHRDAVRWVAFSPDGHTLATAHADRTARLWDATDVRHPAELATLTGHAGPLTSAVFSPDGRTLATTGDTTARLWDVHDPREPRPRGVLTGHSATVWSAAFSPDGHTLATTGWDHQARLWDISAPDDPHALAMLSGHSSIVWSAAFSPDGRTLATTGDSTVKLWDLTDRTRPRNTFTMPGGVYTVAFSPNGHDLAISDASAGARLQDLRELPLFGHDDVVSTVAFRPDGRLLATGSWDHTVRLWDVTDSPTRIPVATLTGPADFVRSVAFSPDGRTLAAASNDGTIRLWDVDDPRTPRHLATLAHHTPGEAACVAFIPDGHTLATAGNRSVMLWDVGNPAAPRELAELGGFPRTVGVVVPSPDGRTLATTAEGEKTARLWDITDPRSPREIPFPFGRSDNIPAGAFSPDGRTLAMVGNTRSTATTVRLVDLTDRPHPRILAALTGHTGVVYSVAFSPDGRRVLTSSADRTVRLWDLADPHDPRLLSTFTGHSGDIPAVAFRPDGHTFATGSNDHTARLWETDADAVAERICRLVHPKITTTEWDRFFPGLPYRSPCPH